MSDRRFNGRQRVALYLSQDGRCAQCGVTLEPGWHADHKFPRSRGGATDVINGQALCPTCNLKKGATVENMDAGTIGRAWPQSARDWQLEAWEKYLSSKKKDWLLCATPGAGKTKWALHLARYLLDHGTVKRVVIVAPTQTIRDQWVDQQIVKLEVVQNEHGGLENRKDFEGIVVTYAQVASQPDLQRKGCREATLVIFDEIHHAGFPNRSWGDRARHAFDQSVQRIGLTGTPWRRPGSGQIPFVSYDEQGQVCVDFAYEYGAAVGDEVCRAIEFRAFDGEVEYVYLDSCASRPIVYTLEDEDDTTSVLRDLLKPEGAWIHSMLEKAHQELMNIRRGNDGEGAVPDAKGLVIADNQADARIISKQLEMLTKEKPEIIISDEPDSEQALERFKTGPCKWSVAVNKVSEGVDVPALYVGVYATRKKTPLIFRQIVGRFVRRRVDEFWKPRSEEERASVLFMPAVPTLKDLASDIESELRHIVDVEREEFEREEAERRELGLNADSDSENRAIPTDISSAKLDTVIVAGKIYSQEEYTQAQAVVERIGFRSDEVTKVADLLREIGQVPVTPKGSPPPPPEDTPRTTLHKYKKALLGQVERLARAKAMALDINHKDFNKDLIRRFGGRRHELSIKQLEEMLRWLDQLNTNPLTEV